MVLTGVERVDTIRRAFHPAVGPVVVAIGSIATVAYIGAVDPNDAGHYPTCPSLLLTGFYCPGCGSLRAIHALAHGSVAGAWDMNILLVLVAPWLVWRWFRWFARSLGRPIAVRPAPQWAILLLVGLICAYWVLRNVPLFAPYLAP